MSSSKIFSTLIFVIGIILIVFSLKIANQINKCSNQVNNATRGLLIIGVMLVSISGTNLVCGCCNADSLTGKSMLYGFVLLNCLLAFTCMVLSSIIHSKCPEVRQNITPLIVMSTVLLVATLGYLGYSFYSE